MNEADDDSDFVVYGLEPDGLLYQVETCSSREEADKVVEGMQLINNTDMFFVKEADDLP